MSNVLIGIIGVILFIGLALAGALFLGPRFQEATTNSKVSAWSQAQGQVAHAVNLRELSEGIRMPASLQPDNIRTELADKGYLKSAPTNPWGDEYYFVLRDVDGYENGNAAYIMNGFYADREKDMRFCAAIAKRAGLAGGTDTAPPSMTKPVGQFGCFKNTGSYGGGNANLLWAYTRI
jgi:hypothetical protein